MVDHADTILLRRIIKIPGIQHYSREDLGTVCAKIQYAIEMFSRDCYFFPNTSVRHSEKSTGLNADALSSALESALKYVCPISVTFARSCFMPLENHALPHHQHVYVLRHYPLMRTQMVRQINGQTTRNRRPQMILQVASLGSMLLARQLLLGSRRKSQRLAQFSSQFLRKYQNSHPTNEAYDAGYQENSMKPNT